ncbi:UNVERIFIED_CONTAM: 2,3-bisphosphoglycerate-dependent phosphoglycerate mutase [Sesamum radiatum]|uniref:phosphoglycerate mutase (2,3-diphosphoglycerate-dependent) n=1 Tax=Sesamum radiatum TaxID=300843 RepID=A0AAW2SJR0_SESRA
MAATAFHQAIGTLQSHGYFSNSGLNQENGIASFRLISKGLKLDTALLRRETYCSRKRSFSVIEASASQTTVFEPVSSPSNDSTTDSKKKSNEAALILIRHGESMWNEKNLFTGCVDVPLTKKGVEEAIEAGKRISNIPVDMIYTSALIRAQMTAMLAMTEHRRKKGLNKQETADRYGNEQVHVWRRSYDTPPPNGESLEMCAERAVAYFKECVISLELSTGIPMLYIFKEGSFIRRGSPVAPNEAGVYAYTKASTIVGTRTWLKFDVNYERKWLSDVIFWGNLQSALWK